MKTKLTLFVLLLILIFNFEKGIAQAPAWAWAKSAGGAQADGGAKVARDVSGNVLLTGGFGSSSITFGTTTLTNASGTPTSDVFIVKYDASGNVLWAKSAGGAHNDRGYGITTDAGGNILVTGAFESSSITFGTITLTNSNNEEDFFVVKYDASGNVLWAQSAGGNDHVYGADICTDASQNVLVTGVFASVSVTFGTTTLINAGFENIFTLKYDASGNVLWAKAAGGLSNDQSAAIAADANGNVVITGQFHSNSIAFGATVLTNSDSINSPDIFVAKYDAAGNVLWAARPPGDWWDGSNDVMCDGGGNVIITGCYASYNLDFGVTTLNNSSGSCDFFVAKYHPSGFALWAKSAGGTSTEVGYAIATDAIGNVLVAGNFLSPVMTTGITSLNNSGGFDIFILKYSVAGNEVWAKSVGGTAYDWDSGICTDAGGNIYITGSFASPSLSFGSTTLTNAGGDDFFIAKLGSTSGIADASAPLSMTSVFPNPATDYITINTNVNKKQVITITDITGKIIYSTTTLSDKTIINTKDFSQGIYAVQLQAGDAVETKRMVITR